MDADNARASSRTTQDVALVIRADIGEMTLDDFPDFQRQVRSVVELAVVEEVANFVGKTSMRSIPPGLLRISSSSAANPWVEVIESATELGTMVTVSGVIGAGLIKAEKILNSLAALRTHGSQVKATKAKNDADRIESNLRAAKALAELEKLKSPSPQQVRDVAAQQQEQLEQFTIDAGNFVVKIIPAQAAREIRQVNLSATREAAAIAEIEADGATA